VLCFELKIVGFVKTYFLDTVSHDLFEGTEENYEGSNVTSTVYAGNKLGNGCTV
jgi:hypothetical protein